MNDGTTVFNISAFIFVPPPLSDAAGHNRVYLRAGLDHLSGHGGKHPPELLGEPNPPSEDDAEHLRRSTSSSLLPSVGI